jgi:hypothetical protein
LRIPGGCGQALGIMSEAKIEAAPERLGFAGFRSLLRELR